MRVEDQRPSASEQAARDDRNRQNIKKKDPAVTTQSAQQGAAKQQVKESKSVFDQVLEQAGRSSSLPSASEALKFDMKIKDALSDRERGREPDKSDRKKDKDDDKKIKLSDEKETGKSSREVDTKDKIFGKQDTGGQSSGGGSGSFDEREGSSGQFGQRSFKQGSVVKVDPSPLGAQGLQRQDSQYDIKAALQHKGASNEIPKQVLDQIVQQIRIGLNQHLDKEIHLQLSEKIFRGLALKVSSSQGKIVVSFLTGNPDVRRLFESQKGSIRQALTEKGIHVSHIQVQFLG